SPDGRSSPSARPPTGLHWGMRRAFFALAIAACSGQTIDPEPAADALVYVTVGADAVTTARGVAYAGLRAYGAQVAVETDGEVAVVPIMAADLPALSEAMHEEHHRCGGFMLHDSLEDA